MKMNMFKTAAVMLAAIVVGCAAPTDAKETPAGKTLSSISVSPDTLSSMDVGDDELATVTGHWSDSTTSVVTDAVWTVEPSGIVTVSAGTIHAVAAGDAVVTATKSGRTDTVSVHVNTPVVGVSAPTKLFSGTTLSYFVDGTTPAGTENAMIAPANSSGTISTAADKATATFAAYPDYWDGMVGWVQKPSGTTSASRYDLSGVKHLRFKIKSATIQPSELAFFIQWQESGTTNGNEYTVALNNLGVTDLTVWNQVSVDLASGGSIPDTSNQGTRYQHTVRKFFTDDGNKHVDTAFALKWYGSANGAPNSGPLQAGEAYEIGDIEFLDASDQPVDIAAGIDWPVVTADPIYVYSESPASTYTITPDYWTADGVTVSTVVDSTAAAAEGTKSIAVTKGGVAGAGGTYLKLSEAVNASLLDTYAFSINTDGLDDYQDLEIKLESGASNHSVFLKNYTASVSGAWKTYQIPLADFTGLTSHNGINNLGFWHPKKTGAVDTTGTFYIDNIRFIDLN